MTNLLRLLALALWSSSTLHPLSLGPVDMMRRNPTFVVRFRARSHSRPIGSDDRNLIRGVNLLGLTGRLLCALAAFASATLLWEESTDPGAVDEVTCAAKCSAEE